MTGKLVALVISLFLTPSLFADDTCATCPKRKVEGMPTPANMETIATIASKAASKDSGLDTKTDYFCMKYENIESDSLYSYAKEIDASPYPIESILQNPACKPRKIGGGNKVTIMQLTVEDVYSRKEHMEKMYNYIMKKHKKESIFTNAVNALNTDGMTVLDYIEFNLKKGVFATEDSKVQIGKVRDFVCSHGGVYSKYKDQKCL